jgi:TRAP-type uncharacterized transport system substrate-binding protein
MKSTKRRVANAVIAVGMVLPGSHATAEELRIGTASQGGAFYPVGQAISSLVNKYADGLTSNNLAVFASKALKYIRMSPDVL